MLLFEYEFNIYKIYFVGAPTKITSEFPDLSPPLKINVIGLFSLIYEYL